MAAFSESDVRSSWRWLGHADYTELVALHPAYKPGKENYENNKAHDAFPRTSYARSADEVVAFAWQHHDNRMVCYGINERPQAFKNERGYCRAAREDDIATARNLLIDIDLEAKVVTAAHQQAAEGFLSEADSYFQDLGLKKPVRAFTGRGFHLLFAYPAVAVSECPDLAARQRRFTEAFKDDYHKELANLDARIDSTFELRRMAKVYGTAKPDVGALSRFYGATREEDSELRMYLLSMKTSDEGTPLRSAWASPGFGAELVHVNGELPTVVRSLVSRDERLRALWAGQGKQDGDTSSSGYDFSLVRRLMALGYRDFDGLATALALRPNGAVRQSSKDEQYIRRTIASALLS